MHRVIRTSPDLAHQVTGLVGSDGGSNDGSRDSASPSKRHLRRHIDVGNVLVLAEKGEMEQDGKRGGVGGKDNQLGDTAVEGLGGFVGTLLQLTVVSRLLNEIEDLLGKSLIGLGPCGGVVFGHFDFRVEEKGLIGSLLSSPEGGFLVVSVQIHVV